MEVSMKFTALAAALALALSGTLIAGCDRDGSKSASSGATSSSATTPKKPSSPGGAGSSSSSK
jgi:hypothetical protein